MDQLSRRGFLQGAIATAGAAAIGGPFQGLVARAAGSVRGAAPLAPLVPVADLRDGEVRLHVPEGFRYRSFHDTETEVVLDDGTVLPGRHDGMAAFPGPGRNVILVRNHELNNPGPAFGPGEPYDAMAQGGTTTIEVTPKGRVVQAFTSLNGTQMNCSGGPMPWDSWITCEETINGPDVGPDFTGASNVTLQKRHGFIFEVPAGGQSNRKPITRAGRFAHEAVAFDPDGGILYLTEDNFAFPSGFYRYIPNRNPMRTGRLDNRGRLQMLAVRGTPNADLARRRRPGSTFEVTWVDIEDPAPTFPFTPGVEPETTNDEALVYVGDQGRAQGAAYFSRLEGAAFDDGVVYFTSTQGGGPAETDFGPIEDGYGNGSGQVWAYHVNERMLELVFQSSGPEVLDLPDNVTTSPRGTLVLCEDNVEDNYIRGLTQRGRIFDIALNRVVSQITGDPRFNDEFAGSTFSPNGNTLFVNIQASRGMSFAIWGPWEDIGV
jgi:secreted PhoX family phosphatase